MFVRAFSRSLVPSSLLFRHHGCLFLFLNWFYMLRIDPLEKEMGVDISHHKGSAYDMSGASKVKHIEDVSVRRQ
jgi:ammonia channel protein AmtB